jgi:hypothetical protein
LQFFTQERGNENEKEPRIINAYFAFAGLQ